MKTELIENNEENQDLMQLDPEGTLTIILRSVDGERLLNLQKAILLSIEEVGCCERSGSGGVQECNLGTYLGISGNDAR